MSTKHHLVDYVLFLKKDLVIYPNPNEIKTVQYVSQRDLQQLIGFLFSLRRQFSLFVNRL